MVDRSQSLKTLLLVKLYLQLVFMVVGCSFIAGTPVLAESGEKPIEQLKRGHKVLTCNEKTGKQSYHPVTQTFAAPKDELYNLTLPSSTGK